MLKNSLFFENVKSMHLTTYSPDPRVSYNESKAAYLTSTDIFFNSKSPLTVFHLLSNPENSIKESVKKSFENSAKYKN